MSPTADAESDHDGEVRLLGGSRASPGLLVSVRSVAEAAAALEGGADLIDVKEPARGPLGMADPATIAAIVDFVRSHDASGRITTSAALGELRDWAGTAPAFSPSHAPDLLKVGLAGEGCRPDWPERWTALRDGCRGCDPGTRWIAVAYVDAVAAAPPPEDVVEQALARGAVGVLFDTFDKSAGGLRAHLDDDRLGRLVDFVHRKGGIVAVAGRIGVDDLPGLIPTNPDVIAVRSAVCSNGDRDSTIDPGVVRTFRSALETCDRRPVPVCDW